MITGIVLENFKCFERVEIHPKRVTCFVGANGTGKSSVLQAFGLLKQMVESIPFSERADALSSNKSLLLQGPLVNVSNPLDLFSLGRAKIPQIELAGSILDGEEIKSFCFGFQTLLSTFSPMPTSDPQQSTLALRTVMRLRMVPALRGFTRPAYKLGNERVDDVSLEESFSQQEEQTATNLAYSRRDLHSISPLLERVTGVRLNADTVPPQSVEVSAFAPWGLFNIVLEGFGTNSLIMLLLQVVTASSGATVMIEEPEIHLHPKAQAELAEVLAEAALEEDKQVIMTTHSEHITGRLLTLVAEGKLTPDDVAIYAFEKDEKGVCTAKDLRVNSDGTIEGGINDFFETNLKEMNRFAQAQFDRLKPSE